MNRSLLDTTAIGFMAPVRSGSLFASGELPHMITYDIAVSQGISETFKVKLVGPDATLIKVFRTYADFSKAMVVLGIAVETIDSLVPEFAQKGYAAIHDQELKEDAVHRFELVDK
jgi:hypothetical protein